MFLGVVGFLMVVIIVAALIRGKSNPVPLFVMVPVIAALICGFTPVEIFGFVLLYPKPLVSSRGKSFKNFTIPRIAW